MPTSRCRCLPCPRKAVGMAPDRQAGRRTNGNRHTECADWFASPFGTRFAALRAKRHVCQRPERSSEMQRREFLGAITAAAGVPLAAGLLPPLRADEPMPSIPLGPPPETVRGGMRHRPLGRTGVEVSAIGLGGHHIGRQRDEAESIRIIRSAIDAGITFMDNSWDYHNGGSEERMGKALRDGYRAKVFLMTKIDGRTAAEAN